MRLLALLDRFREKTVGGHMEYIGYTSHENKLGFCIFYECMDYLASFDSPSNSLSNGVECSEFYSYCGGNISFNKKLVICKVFIFSFSV